MKEQTDKYIRLVVIGSLLIILIFSGYKIYLSYIKNKANGSLKKTDEKSKQIDKKIKDLTDKAKLKEKEVEELEQITILPDEDWHLKRND